VERWSYEKLRIQTNPEADNGGQSLPMKNKQKEGRRRHMECSVRQNIYYRGEKTKDLIHFFYGLAHNSRSSFSQR
jgi:hypothetical protein